MWNLAPLYLVTFESEHWPSRASMLSIREYTDSKVLLVAKMGRIGTYFLRQKIPRLIA